MKEFGEKFYTNVMRLDDKNHAEKSLLDGLSEMDAELVKTRLEAVEAYCLKANGPRLVKLYS